jgi:hypothetical protein
MKTDDRLENVGGIRGRAYFHTLDCKVCSAHHAKMKKLEAKQNKNNL